MTIPSPGTTTLGQQRQAIEQEAARLFHKARELGTTEAWDEAYRWIEQSPAHGVAFAKAEAGWEMAEGLRLSPDKTPVEPAVGSPTTPAARDDEIETAPRLSRRTFIAVAASSGVAITASLALWHLGRPERYSTRVGEARLIHLADGSQIRLNTDSIIDVSLQKERRTVHFLKGEARFDVAHDAARPFLVTARDGTVRAADTVFNLRLRKDFTELTVIEGQVAVVDGGTPATPVPAGTSAMMRSAAVSVMKLTPGDLARRTAWQQGEIHLEGETLSQAVEEFNRYRVKPLVIGDPDLSSLSIGGTFSAARSDDFVEALKQSFGIRVMEGNDGAVILLPENEKPGLT